MDKEDMTEQQKYEAVALSNPDGFFPAISWRAMARLNQEDDKYKQGAESFQTALHTHEDAL